MRQRLHIAVGFAVSLFSAARAEAAGFHIDEQDARATGRAGAVTADPGNGSAIYYNPAGVGTLRGFQLRAGVSLVTPMASFRARGTEAKTSAETNTFPLPQAYATYRMDELVAIGFGLSSPFGLAVDWPASSPGRTNIRHIELRTFFLTPVIALNFSRWVPGLAIGGGANLVASSVRLERDILFGSSVADVALSGTSLGVGATAGIVYRPPQAKWLALGANYRSPVRLNFTGDANFSADPAFRPSLPPDGQVTTSILLPHKVNLGVAVNPVSAWQVELDFNWTGWSSYESLTLKLPGGQSSFAEKNWHDTVTMRLGTEVAIGSIVALRGGVAWDPTPVPRNTLDFQLPDVNRVVVTAGVGAKAGSVFSADLGVLYIPPGKRSTSTADPFRPPVKGTFEASALVVGLSAGIAFDARPMKVDAPH